MAISKSKRILKVLTAFSAVCMILLFSRNESEANTEKLYVAGELIVQVKGALPENLANFGI
ncbi:MAG TPA: hypothetical protein VK826_16800, partial [Bacteroidia bacterium]|nr:hypothetical protein [Bacteroidia bacterium]